MREKTTQVNFRVGPKLKELIFALSETSGQSTGKVVEQAIFHEALARVRADVRSGALKASESRIDIDAVKNNFGEALKRLSDLLLMGYGHRLDGLTAPDAKPCASAEPSAPCLQPPTVNPSLGHTCDATGKPGISRANDFQEQTT